MSKNWGRFLVFSSTIIFLSFFLYDGEEDYLKEASISFVDFSPEGTRYELFHGRKGEINKFEIILISSEGFVKNGKVKYPKDKYPKNEIILTAIRACYSGECSGISNIYFNEKEAKDYKHFTKKSGEVQYDIYSKDDYGYMLFKKQRSAKGWDIALYFYREEGKIKVKEFYIDSEKEPPLTHI